MVVKNMLINFLAISGDSKHFLFFSEKKRTNRPLEAGCGPQIFVYPKSYFFCDFKPHAKREKSNPAEEREREQRR